MEGHSIETDPRISAPIHRIKYINSYIKSTAKYDLAISRD